MRMILLLLLGPLVFAQQSSTGPAWIQLFNGKDISGWVNIGGEKWTVDDGVLNGLTLTKGYGYLQTEKSFKDFELSIKFLCVGRGNSGVFFRVHFQPGTANVTRGGQVEVDCTIGRHSAGIYEQKRRWLVWPSTEKETVVRQGEWNEMFVKVEGNRYITRLNGVPMVDYTDPTPDSDDGPIALQLHSGGDGHMRFKDIWIRDLSRR